MAHDEQLFERFRRRGDVAALGELFDRAAPALLRVALHLVRDPGAAEDLLQATFLRAFEVREEWDGRRPVLPWLCGILQNRARHERWQGGREPDPARLTVASPVDPVQAAQQSEFDAAVDAAIAALPEVYRPVLRLHLAYGHQPAEIAHALERPPATVRSQLARGLELLRRLLPLGFAGGAALALTAGRGLAGVKQAVLGHASAVSALVTGAVIGGAAMIKKVAMAVVVGLLLAGAWLVWPGSEAAPVAGNGKEAAAQPLTAPVAKIEAMAEAAGSTDRRVSVDAAKPATTGSLRIAVRWGDDGSPAWGVLVSAMPGTPDGSMLQRTAKTGDDGCVFLADVPAAHTWIAADRGGKCEAEVVLGSTVDVTLTIPAGIQVHGRVLDEHGTAVPAAHIWLSNGQHDYCDGRFVVDADQAGQFSLRGVEPERFLSASSPGLRSAIVQPVRAEVGTTVQVELVLCGSGASLCGRVADPEGRPAADARVYVGYRELGLRWHPAIHAELRPPLELRTGAVGTFAALGLQPGSKQPVWVRAAGCCAWYQVVQLESDGDTQLAVQLQTGAALVGRVTDHGGKPLAGAGVMYRSTAWYPARGDLNDDRGPGWSHYGVETDAEGRYRIDCITPGTLRLLSRKDALQVRSEVAVAAGETATWDPVLVEIAIRGRVVGERGEALAAVQVTGYPPRGQGNMASERTDAEGGFVCHGLAPVPYVLSFHAAEDRTRARPAAMLWGVRPGGEAVLVRLPDAAIPTATIVGRLLDGDGQPAQNAQVRFSTAGLLSGVQTSVDPKTGDFRVGPLYPGTWRLQGGVGQYDEHRRSAWSEPFVLVRGETHDAGTVQMPATGSIALSASGPDGQPLDGLMVALEDSTGWSEEPWSAGKLDHGKLRIDHVAPAGYRLQLGGVNDLPTVFQPVTVTAGQETRVELRVPKGVGVKLVLSPVSEPVPIHETLVWMRDGELWKRETDWWEGNGERTWPMRLLPGSYELTMTSETGRREINRFVIGAEDAADRVIAIKLP